MKIKQKDINSFDKKYIKQLKCIRNEFNANIKLIDFS